MSEPFEWKFENGEAFGFIFLPFLTPLAHDCREPSESQALSLRDLFVGKLFGGSLQLTWNVWASQMLILVNGEE